MDTMKQNPEQIMKGK
jgi:hypothetical protein